MINLYRELMGGTVIVPKFGFKNIQDDVQFNAFCIGHDASLAKIEALKLEVSALTDELNQFKRGESIILDLYQKLTGETPRDVQFNAFCIGYKAAHTWITNGSLPPDETPVLVKLKDGTVCVGEIRWDRPSFEDSYSAFQYWDDPTNDGKDWEFDDIIAWMGIPA